MSSIDEKMSNNTNYPPNEYRTTSGEASESDVRPYTGDDLETQSRKNHEGSNQESELLRTISEYTENDVATGAAAEETYIREKLVAEGKLPPPPPPKYSFFAQENKELRISVLKKYSKIILAFWVYVLTVWSIYWGSMYKRETRYVNLKYLVGLESDPSGVISDALRMSTSQGMMPSLGTWEFRYNLTENEIQYLIHEQKYWAAIYVSANNVSELLLNAFQSGTNISTTNFVHGLYETARDPVTMGGIVSNTLFQFQSLFVENLQNYGYPSILSNLTDSQFSNLKNTNLLTSYPLIQYTDAIPIEPVTMGPLQVGLIYIIIITFFQVMWLGDINGTVAKKIFPKQYILFQLLISHVTYLFVSLAFSCLNAAFQISMNRAWKGGFGVFWMVSYMTMAAVGGANNNISLICFATYPPLMGFWLLFFVVINISATFAPIQLCPKIFRYTYALPIKNAYELMKIVLFNVTKTHMGRYFGVLAAWIALNSILLPFCIFFFATMTKRKIVKEQKQIVEKELKQKMESKQ